MSGKVLVTGAAGFIGSNLCHHLTRNGYSVVGLDAMRPEANMRNLDGINFDMFEFLRIDLTKTLELYLLDELKNDISFVIHLAAESHVDRSLKWADGFWRTNVIGTYNLFDKCKSFPNLEVVVNQITDEVYGERRPKNPAAEGDVFNPRPPYAHSKAAQYFAGKSFLTTNELPIISTFPVNCFGPRQNKEKIIPKFITRLSNNQKVPLMKSTHFIRDWLPVCDMCAALQLLIEKKPIGEDFNIGAFNHHTNMVLTHKLLNLLDKDPSLIEIVPDRITHDSCYAVTNNKITSLGLTNPTPFDDYLEEVVDWYVNLKE